MLDTEVTIIKHKKEVEYTTIYNDCINDNDLSAASLGVLVYVMSKPDDWKIQIKDLCNRFNIGRDKTYNVINSLVDCGYMKRVALRRQDGSFIKTVICASDKKIFIESIDEPVVNEAVDLSYNENKQPIPENPEVVTDEKVDKQPLPENPDTVNQEVAPYIQKKDLTKNNNNNLSTARDDATASSISINPAVVFLLDKIRNLPNFDIAAEKMEGWVIKYGKNYVESKIEFMKSKTKILSPGGYLKAALEYDWGSVGKTASAPIESNILKVKEERSLLEPSPTYDAQWFAGLSEAEKVEVCSDAAKSWLLLPAMLEEKKLSPLDPEFVKSPWVRPMIDAFRNYRRL